MSGFVAVARADGRSVDDALIERMTAAMAYRGPDLLAASTAAGVGLGHAAFHTTVTPEEASQPLVLDRRIRIVADARIDDRDGLVRRLRQAGRGDLDAAADAELLAHAYDAWGERMLDVVVGDFAFVVWDGARRRLFAARDHMGVKPCYYALAGNDLIVGNTLAAFHLHPAVDDALDEHAIGDFLLFGVNRHPDRTTFARIARLPAAHALCWEPGGKPRIERYWRLETRGPAMGASERHCNEAFSAALETAVADRVRGNRAVVLMSGGLDSTTVAAIARDVMRRRHDEIELSATTFVYDHLMEDVEPRFARDVAQHLGIPHRCIPLDDEGGSALWSEEAAWSAEPNEQPASARMVRYLRAAHPEVRVAFTGQGGDPAMHVSPADAAHRAARDGRIRFCAAMLAYRLRHGRLPRVGLRTHLRRTLRGRRDPYPQPFPPWLRPEFAARNDLKERHRSALERQLDADALRPDAAFQLAGPEWSFWLETCDPGANGFLLEYRHPLLDIRLLQLAMRLPVLPCLAEKHIVRQVMRGRLPGSVLRRRKAPLPGFPAHLGLLERPLEASRLAELESHLAEFVDVPRFRELARQPQRLHPWEAELVTRPLGLALWLHRHRSGRPERPARRGRVDTTVTEHRPPEKGTMPAVGTSLLASEPSDS